MRCKKHYTDLSSIVGVCASCLRERLFYLVAAQEQAQTLEERNHDLETHPVFPRSVSPYITRRKSDNSTSSTNNQRNSHYSLPDQRFFSTPQLAPTAGGYNPCGKKKHSFVRFSLLSNLFRSKKRKEESDSNPRFSVSVSNSGGGDRGGDSATSAMSSAFWFSNIRSGGGGRKKQPLWFNASSTASGAGLMRQQYCPDRGMSPVRYSDCGGAEDEFCDGSSGYETCESRKQTPWRTPAHPSVRRGGGGGGHGKNVSGLNICLSPLVRASPCRYWNQNGTAPADGGDIRGPVKPHLSNTKSFCANRSRKLADFGRCNPNR
ncbi:hypothetical protein L1987_59374 [Smallanthus sonchifolius]|uniref:Uncharacterized protein n=1 Tax=Smallanthus sonchifolius TaxID=185202 RepID=A0ACB9D5B8_9ASTR|nr:hypothetical protein L1987_59374 [Smallanthus sonchifolius]